MGEEKAIVGTKALMIVFSFVISLALVFYGLINKIDPDTIFDYAITGVIIFLAFAIVADLITEKGGCSLIQIKVINCKNDKDEQLEGDE